MYVCAVRQKAKEMVGFVQDEDRLREARKQAKQTRDKYVGYSSEEATSRYSKLSLSFHQIEHQRFISLSSLPLSPPFPPGDRYAPEPRSRTSKPSGWSSSHYDEDPRGPIGEYHDDVEAEENGYKDDAGDEHRTATQG